MQDTIRKPDVEAYITSRWEAAYSQYITERFNTCSVPEAAFLLGSREITQKIKPR
jgi:hypothetical protein